VTFKLREVVKPYKKIIGFASVSLHGAAVASEKGKASAFIVPLRLQGLVCGTRLQLRKRLVFTGCSRVLSPAGMLQGKLRLIKV
jgi:hypothetical protein